MSNVKLNRKEKTLTIIEPIKLSEINAVAKALFGKEGDNVTINIEEQPQDNINPYLINDLLFTATTTD